jgi:crossover junction endodeoxyribonuclease RuvC
MRIIGLDLSLTATGVADSHGAPQLIKPRTKGHERLEQIAGAVDSIVLVGNTMSDTADLVVVEGPSFGSEGSAYHQLAGLWWLITHNLWTARIPYAVVSPQARAKYATGKGNAGKDAVLAAVVRRFPALEVNDNNVADAVVLMAMGCDRAGVPLVDMPAVNREALAKVDWPPLLCLDGAA